METTCEACERPSDRLMPTMVGATCGLDREVLNVCQECGQWSDADYVDFLIVSLDEAVTEWNAYRSNGAQTSLKIA